MFWLENPFSVNSYYQFRLLQNTEIDKMWVQVVVTTLVALGLAPCVLQRACRPRARPADQHQHRPPSAVCMHRHYPGNQSFSERLCKLEANSFDTIVPGQHVPPWSTHKPRRAPVARVVVQALRAVPLAAVLRLLSLLLLRALGMMGLKALLGVMLLHQVAAECKNCMTLGKDEKAMFRAHSAACLAQSQVEPGLVDGLLRGELVEDAGLKRHVYCVLLKCKVISKDGKLQKAAVLAKMANRGDGKNVTKVLERCSEQRGDTPEDLAWNLFRCGYDKKTVLFDYMPANIGAGGDSDNDA